MGINKLQVTLKELLEEKKGKNPRFSLRALARHLKISPSALSQFISGKKAFSEKRRRDLEIKIQKFLNNPDLKLEPASIDLSAEQHKLLNHWKYDAIVLLTRLKSFQAKPAWIAEQLSLSVSEVEQALEVLVKTGLLIRDKKGHLKSPYLWWYYRHKNPDNLKRHESYFSAIREKIEKDPKRKDTSSRVTCFLAPKGSLDKLDDIIARAVHDELLHFTTKQDEAQELILFSASFAQILPESSE